MTDQMTKYDHNVDADDDLEPFDEMSDVLRRLDRIETMVSEMHAVMRDLGQQIGPLVQQVQTGGIMSMLMGRKK